MAEGKLSPMQKAVIQFLQNLREPVTFANDVLQARPDLASNTLARFTINTTVGIGGLFDVATRLKLANPPTGFSATLSTWGAHPGPFLVVPILGPSTLRDGVGYLGDYGVSYGINVADVQNLVEMAVGGKNAGRLFDIFDQASHGCGK